MQLVLHY